MLSYESSADRGCSATGTVGRRSSARRGLRQLAHLTTRGVIPKRCYRTVAAPLSQAVAHFQALRALGVLNGDPWHGLDRICSSTCAQERNLARQAWKIT